jgi:hypothetical protein
VFSIRAACICVTPLSAIRVTSGRGGVVSMDSSDTINVYTLLYPGARNSRSLYFFTGSLLGLFCPNTRSLLTPTLQSTSTLCYTQVCVGGVVGWGGGGGGGGRAGVA